jgi:hypothetical protein
MNFFVSAQNNTIVNDGNEWAVLQYGLAPMLIDGMLQLCIIDVHTEQIVINGDSVLAEITCKKVFSVDPATTRQTFAGLVRETDQKVFFIAPNATSENVLYDFSVETGNQVEFVDRWGNEISLYANVDYVNINEASRKRIQLSDSPSGNDFIVDTWIEGIGSMRGFLYPGIGPAGGDMQLLCLSQNETLVYQNPLFAKCYYSNESKSDVANILDYKVYTGLQETQNSDISVEILNDKITVASANQTLSHIELFNLSGQKVYSEKSNANQNEININFLTDGLYFLKIHGNNGQINNFKFIKK